MTLAVAAAPAAAGMPWMALSFGMQVLGGLSGASQRRSQAQAQSIIDAANAEAANINRDSQNRVSAAASSLKSYATSINNQRQGTAVGAKINALTMNVARAMDQMSQGSTQQSLQAAEQLGAITAQAAASGTGGGSIDLVKSTLGLRRALQHNNLQRTIKMTQHDYKDRTQAAISELSQSFDPSTSVAAMDYGVTAPPLRMQGGEYLSALSKVDFSLLRDQSLEWFGSKQPAPTTAPSYSAGDIDYLSSVNL